MKSLFLDRLRLLESSVFYREFRGIKRGIEKESLRVDKNGNLAKTSHPIVLGSSLMHPQITTDFSESQLEFITPPFEGLDEPLKCLTQIHHFTQHHLMDEILWPGSMPCLLPSDAEIPIAEFGSSNLGKLKQIYRKGLGHRYGRKMQTISGVHYNFSLPFSFWEKYYDLMQSDLSLPLFISEQYLGMVRNSLRFGWILPLLFGASPAAAATFFKKSNPYLQSFGKETLIGNYATSLRLSDLGYNNKIQSEMRISYNSLLEFLSSIRQAIHTQHPFYSKMGVKVGEEYQQLSDCVFQIEDEYYSLIRPKRVAGLEERMLTAILHNGIEYIEVRGLDLNPFEPLGVDPKMLYLVDAFLIFCLLKESPLLEEEETQRVRENINSVVLLGRQPSLQLLDTAGKARNLLDWGRELLEDIEQVARILDNSYASSMYKEACGIAKDQLLDNESLLAARILQEMSENKESYIEFGLRWGDRHHAHFKHLVLPADVIENYNKMSRESFIAQQKLENSSIEPFDTYLQRYLQT